MALGTTLKRGSAEAGEQRERTNKRQARGWKRGIGSKLRGAWGQGGPKGALQVNDLGGQRRQVRRVEEIGVESPVADGGIIDGAGSGPGRLADLTGKHFHHGTVVIKVHTAPIFQQAKKILHPAAVVGGGGSDIARKNSGVDGVTRSD